MEKSPNKMGKWGHIYDFRLGPVGQKDGNHSFLPLIGSPETPYYRIIFQKQLSLWIIWYPCIREELLLIAYWNVPGHETKQLPSHNGKGLLQLPLARHVIFWGPTRWYPELHTKVTLLLYVLPVEMASAFSMEGWSPQVISRTEENFWVLYTIKTIPSMSHTPSDSSILILN